MVQNGWVVDLKVNKAKPRENKSSSGEFRKATASLAATKFKNNTLTLVG
jgi:hypothetical protein